MQNWLKDAVFYEIYPQSFYDGNGDGIGDIRGIIEKLDYIESVGFNALWLNPCFVSPFMDAGYDVTDYYTVAPRYGTNSDLRELFCRAHERGMHVLLDLVPGHTSDQNPWFKASCEATRNKYSDWFIWTDNAFRVVNGPSANFKWVSGMHDRDGSFNVNFFSHQPALNWGFARCDESWQLPVTHPAVQEVKKEFKNIMRFWLDLGADGFRVDMASSLVKNDDDGSGNRALWNEFRAMLDSEYPEAVIISEWGCPEKAIPAGFHMDFYLQFNKNGFTDLFHNKADINPDCKGDPHECYYNDEAQGSAQTFIEEYSEILSAIKGKGYACMPSGNHDVIRLGYRKSEQMMKLCFTQILTMPGVPFVYYGDEIGMTITQGLKTKEGSYCSRTGSRTPMQWDNTVNMGFSVASPEQLYLPVGKGNRTNVAEQETRSDSLLKTVQSLVALRKKTPELWADADLTFIETKSAALAYVRGNKILVAINPTQKSYEIPLYGKKAGKILYSTGIHQKDKNCINLSGKSAVIITLE